jgi:hypothetical protein
MLFLDVINISIVLENGGRKEGKSDGKKLRFIIWLIAGRTHLE